MSFAYTASDYGSLQKWAKKGSNVAMDELTCWVSHPYGAQGYTMAEILNTMYIAHRGNTMGAYAGSDNHKNLTIIIPQLAKAEEMVAKLQEELVTAKEQLTEKTQEETRLKEELASMKKELDAYKEKEKQTLLQKIRSLF